MEQLDVINESKNGKLPAELEKHLPEIAKIIKRMLAVDPCDRPSLETILQSLKLPIEVSTAISGKITLRRENSQTWTPKHFKLSDDHLYIFDKEKDKKAEMVYPLSEWSVLLQTPGVVVEEEQETECINSEEKNTVCIKLEDPIKLGCSFKTETAEQTLELFNMFNNTSA